MLPWFLLLILPLPLPAADDLPAQDADSVYAAIQRPKIGLALSGGGARGCSHVGVLKVLEANRIPVDYIAGTSMGALVGGLYAAGHSAAEIEALFLEADWTDMMLDEPRRRYESFRRMEENRLYLLAVELGLRGLHLQMPRGFRQGRKLSNLLREWTLPVAGTRSFDNLPIPFRAVATDIGNGEMVVLEGGDLVQAIRASMAIPGVLAPVMLDGRLLVDGGTTRNIPVDVVREMGADIVIAVDISEALKPVEELNSSLAISNQTMSLLTWLNVEAMLPLADLVLRPEVEGLGTLDFSDVPLLISKGVAEAERTLPRMATLALPAAQYELHRAGQHSPEFVPPLVARVRVEGLERVDERTLLGRISLRPGDRLDLHVLHRDMARIFGLGFFQMVDFSLIPDKEGVEVVINAREKEWGPNYLRFGLNFKIDESRGAAFSLVTLHNATQINRRGAEWRSRLTVGQEGSIDTEFYQPLDFRGRLFFAPGLRLSKRPIDEYEDGHKIAEWDEQLAVGTLDFGIHPGTSTELRAGLYYGAARVALDTGTPVSRLSSSEEAGGIYPHSPALGGLHAGVRLDRVDRVTFPRRGYTANLEFFLSRTGLGADDDYKRLGGSGSTFFSRGRHTWFASVEGGTSLGSLVPPYHQFTLGGLFSLAGYADQELRGCYAAAGRIGYYASLWALPSSMGQNLFFGGWIEAGNVWNSSGDIGLENLRETLALLVGADTFVGPVYFAWGLAEDDRSRLYLSVGAGF
jgi:NTE family protein